MGCDHIDYDDYFERCNDCGKGNEQIHADECVANGFEVEDGMCNKCGTVLEGKEQ